MVGNQLPMCNALVCLFDWLGVFLGEFVFNQRSAELWAVHASFSRAVPNLSHGLSTDLSLLLKRSL